MAVSLKHAFTSAKVDGTDSTLIQPSNWNSEHTLTLAAGKVLGRDSSGAGAAQELAISVDSTQQSMIPPSGTTAQRPATPAAGMMRYNSTTSKFEGYTSAWGTLGGGATISDTAPTNPQPGDLWWKSNDGQMYIYYNDGDSSQWVIANYFTGLGAFLPLTGGALTGTLGVGRTVSAGYSLQTSNTIGANDGTVEVFMAPVAASNASIIGNVSNHALVLYTNNTERMRIDNSGNVIVTGAGGLGYGTGSGGTVTQITSKATTVTLNKTNGNIITNNAALAATTAVSFTVNNSTVASADTIILNCTNGNYSARVFNNSAGSFGISLKNETGVSLSDAVTLNFAVIKAVTA